MSKCGIKKIGAIVIIILTALFIITSIYVNYTLAESNLESILYYSTCLGETDLTALYIGLKICIPIIIVLSIVLYAVFYDISFGKIKAKFYPFKFMNKHRKVFIIILFIISFIMLLQCIESINYIIDISSKSDLIEKEYVDPKKTKVTFPDEKKNLIVISVESLEYSLFTKSQNGIWDYEVIPELHDLLEDKDSITFNQKKGMYMLQGSSYTTSSVVANNSAVPIKVGPERIGYSKDNYMSGAYTLGELLEKEGYTNEVISGAATAFGSMNLFYEQHGNFNIIDPDTLDKNGYKMSKSDRGNWGFNDKYIFEIAKDRLDTLSKDDKPFNLQLVTIDTHFVDGFVGDYSETKYSRQYENAYATTSKLIYDFVGYVKSQPYYEDTVIVILGDHLAMQSNFINNRMFDDRTIYFCIIDPDNREYKRDRIYTALDTYPTIVSLLNGNIEGDRLGLGVNLFSHEKTLAEEYGVKKLDKELRKKSEFYDKIILSER